MDWRLSIFSLFKYSIIGGDADRDEEFDDDDKELDENEAAEESIELCVLCLVSLLLLLGQ